MVADEQLHTEAFFQMFDRGGDRWLRDVELARGFGDAAAIGGGDEVFELAQVVGGHGNLQKIKGSQPSAAPTQSTFGEGNICGKRIYLCQRIYMWRGDLSPLGCAAAPVFKIKRGAASRPIGDKSPRHR